MILLTGLLVSGLYSCKDDASPSPPNNQDTYDAYFRYQLDGSDYESKTFIAEYGSKIYIAGMSSGTLLVDFALKAQKDQLVSNVPFSLDASGDLSTGIMYVGSDQWMLGGGTFSITKHEKNRVSGNFSGKAYQIEYAGQDPVVVDSAMVTNGVFNDIPVSDQ